MLCSIEQEHNARSTHSKSLLIRDTNVHNCHGKQQHEQLIRTLLGNASYDLDSRPPTLTTVHVGLGEKTTLLFSNICDSNKKITSLDERRGVVFLDL